MTTLGTTHKQHYGNVQNVKKKATVQNKRNLLQHAIIKHKPQRQLEIKVHKPTKRTRIN